MLKLKHGRGNDVPNSYCTSTEVVLAPPEAQVSNNCYLQVSYRFLGVICPKALLFQLIAEWF